MDKLPDVITMGKKYKPAMEITEQAAADEYFEILVEHSMRVSENSREEAESVERQNLGYVAGFYNQETMDRVNRLFRTTHPIFGETAPRGGGILSR